MELRTLGKTELQATRVSMGTMTFGGQVSEQDSIRMVDRTLDAGINFFDTANSYNNGVSETILGKALKGRRHNVVLATKVRNKMGDEPDDAGLSRAAMRKAINASLRRLQADYVDLYYLHLPDWNTPIEETLAAMDELVREGKVRYPAFSNYASWQAVQMMWISENHGYVPPTVAQHMYNALARGIEAEYLAYSKEFGIGLVVYNPLAGGLLTGKHLAASGPTPGTRFDNNKMYQDRFWHDQYFDAVNEISTLASDAGLTMVEFAFRWLLSQPVVDSVILGATNLDQLDDNLMACQGPPLPPDVLAACDRIWEKLRGVTPKYNR
jgi:aryl-alcohol dehydrogenase-like predicted oxidoreductase